MMIIISVIHTSRLWRFYLETNADVTVIRLTSLESLQVENSLNFADHFNWHWRKLIGLGSLGYIPTLDLLDVTTIYLSIFGLFQLADQMVSSCRK